MPPSSKEIIQQLNTIHNDVLSATAMLKQDQILDLQSIETRVKDICETIKTLPDADKLTVRMPLVSLMDDMDKFYEMLKTKHSQIKDQIKSLSPQRQANNAYSKASKFQNPEDS